MKNYLVYLFTFLTFFSSFISCSPDNEFDLKEADTSEHSITNLQLEKDIAFALNSISTITNKIESNRNPLPTQIDQATLDYYSSLVNLDPGSVTVEFVNEILAGYFVANDQGISVLLAQYNYDGNTQQIIADLAEFGWYENLESHNSFESLNQSDKDLVLLANAVIMDLNPTRNGDPGTAIGALIGLTIGSACCGPIGSVIGTIIGAVIGGSTSKL